tara:strand:+ start:4319 stop:5185 length:867 start_codon:yes stop_codon:yes gene_type:complete
MLQILETISQGGRAGKPNEDAFGHTDTHAWVIDGATGVADSELLAGMSDARWLSHGASAVFAEEAARFGSDLKGLTRSAIETMKARFEREALRAPNGRYELPSAAMILAYSDGRALHVANFADCRLLLLGDDGSFGDYTERHGDRSPKSKARTAALLDKVGPGGDPFALPEVMTYLRKARDYQNRADGYWILGLDPEAAEHMPQWTVPLTAPVTGLLMSDGFASLAYDYKLLTPVELITRARDEGLGAVVEAVRKFERVDDPQMKIFPRFKGSDDATAVLFRAVPVQL